MLSAFDQFNQQRRGGGGGGVLSTFSQFNQWGVRMYKNFNYKGGGGAPFSLENGGGGGGGGGGVMAPLSLPLPPW